MNEYRSGPVWSDLFLIFQPSCLALIGTAAATVLMAAVRALGHDLEIQQSGVPHSDAAITINHRQALIIPVISSCALLAFFFFFKSIQLILLLLVSIGAGVGIVFTARPGLQLLCSRYALLRRRLVLCSTWHTTIGNFLLSTIACTTVFIWLLSGSIFLNNVLGICLCIAFTSFVRLPSLKVTASLLTALFFYDIFWVFFSEYIFGKNVMIEAATQQAENPAVTLADALHVNSSWLAKNLDLPVKLVFPEHLFASFDSSASLILGLGDIALPSMLIALLYGEDMSKWQHLQRHLSSSSSLWWDFWKSSYTLPSWIGYIFGLFLALAVGTVFRAAQPALLFLVPSTLTPCILLARRRHELKHLWEGAASPIDGISIRKESIV